MLANRAQANREVVVEVFRTHNASAMLNDTKRMDEFGKQFGIGFTKPPWHVYEFWANIKAAKKEGPEEFAKLAEAVLRNDMGGVINIHVNGKPAAFSVVCGMAMFTEPAAAMQQGRMVASEDIGDIVKILAKYEKIVSSRGHQLGNVGYIADVVVGERFRGIGLGNVLIKESVTVTNENGNTAVMGWTVNPIMGHIFKTLDFHKAAGVGSTGKGIDFAVDEKTGLIIPTVSMPGEDYGKVVAQHYLRDNTTAAKRE
jgi:hypothetical protein